MENKDECLRMDIKTDYPSLERQALWAGLKEGMRVADIGSGSGITSSFLKRIVGESGHVTGFDGSMKRTVYARENYGVEGLEFVNLDINNSLDDLKNFDFIWVRFFLEYHRENSFDIVKRLTDILSPGGILCLIDLDHNCLNHYGLSSRLEKTIVEVSDIVEKFGDFDPYVGRKLYSYLYDLGFSEIDVDMKAHHLIFGELSEVDEFNWIRKIKTAARNSGYDFPDYPDGYDGFLNEFKIFFSDPRRFTYTPIISCRGVKIDS
jgi:ubiquinone/menaquinone biosynthesis C-methylase UbiE